MEANEQRVAYWINKAIRTKVTRLRCHAKDAPSAESG